MKAIADLETFLNALPPCVILDGRGKVVTTNENAAQLLGRPRASMVGLTVDAFVPETSRAAHVALRAAWSEAPVHGPMGVGREFTAVRADGRLVPVEIGLTPLAGVDGPLVLALLVDISERVAAEAVLRESESRFRHLADALPQLIWTTGPLGTVTYASARCLEYTGYSSDEVAEHWPDLLHPDDRERIVSNWRASVVEGREFHAENRLRRHDGVYRWFKTRSTLIRDAGGAVIGWSVSSDDIDDARELTEALRRETERFERVAAAAPGGIYTGFWRPDGGAGMLYASGQFAEVTGLDPASLADDLGPFLERIHPEDRAPRPQIAEELLRNGANFRDTFRFNHPTKGEVWLEMHSVPDLQSDGSVLRHGIVADVTNRKQTESALERNEARLRLFVANAPVALAMFDGEMRYLAASHRWIDDFALDGDNLIGRSQYDVLTGIPARWREANDLGLAGGSTRSDEDTFVLADGSIKWLRWDLQPWHEADGTVGGIVISAEDITLRKRAEEMQLRSQKLEALGTLAGGIAHDFNNIMLAIRGYSELALTELADDHPARESLGQIHIGASRATSLVQQILAFSRPAEPRHVELDLERVIADSIRLFSSLLPAMIELDSDVVPGTPAISADAGQVNQMLMNLTNNAAQAIGRRSGRITFGVGDATGADLMAVRSAGLGVGRYVTLSVRDSGPGMDAITLKQVFDPFFTTKQPGEGTGLGLSTVHSIMRGHDGVVTAMSFPADGAEFRLVFPMAAHVQAMVPDEPATPTRLPEAIAGDGARLLLVDDEAALVQLMTRILTRFGFVVEGFGSVGEALASFASGPQRFDAAVLDFSMPETSGTELAAALLALRPDLPVLVTSGYVPEAEVEAGLAAGISAFVSKSEDIDAICGRIAELVAARR